MEHPVFMFCFIILSQECPVDVRAARQNAMPRKGLRSMNVVRDFNSAGFRSQISRSTIAQGRRINGEADPHDAACFEHPGPIATPESHHVISATFHDAWMPRYRSDSR